MGNYMQKFPVGVEDRGVISDRKLKKHGRGAVLFAILRAGLR